MPASGPETDVVIAGAGPAGLLLATELGRRGARVALVAPDVGQPWPNRYGVWLDEVEGLEVARHLSRTWPRAVVTLDAEREHVLDRVYGRVDHESLRQALTESARASGVRFLEGTVEAATHRRAGTRLSGDFGGGPLRASILVDATGHTPRFVRHRGPRASAFQTAYGVLAELEGPPLPGDRMTLMDWSDPGPAAPPTPGGVPTFLYAMGMGPGLGFFEETALIARPAVSLKLLRRRLEARLEARGVRLGRIQEVERCVIGMDPPRPTLPQRTVGFGAAASMVHPATGYMLAHLAASAPPLAEAIAGGLSRGRPPADVARDAWEVVWSREARRLDELYRFGAEMLLRMDPERTRTFFDAFFKLPADAWQGYLSRTVGVGRLSLAMLGLYRELDPRGRWGIHREVVRQPGRLLRGLLGVGGRR